jgi:O-antigen/teichoic acid export membrane protein
LSGFEAFRSIAKINFLTGVLNFPFVIGGAMLWGLMGVVGGLVLTQAIGCLLSYFALRHEASRSHIPLSLSGWTAELPVLWHFSTPVVLGSLLMAPATWIASALLARQPQGYEQMGIYNAANQVFNALLWLPFVLSQVVLPLLSERFGVKDQRRSTKLLLTSIGINACVVFPLVIIFGLGSPYIMSAFGKNYAPEWPTLIATLITAGLVAVQIPIGNVIAASGRIWLGLSMNLAWCITFIGGTWLMLRLGSLGLAYGRLLAYLVQGAWSLIFTLTAIRKLGNSDENLAAAQVSSKDR